MEHSDLYAAAGGATQCNALAAAFYGRVEKDPTLRPLFPGKTFKCAIEEFSSFLAQFLGGPAKDAEHRWWLSLEESHRRFHIGEKERDAWLANMRAALNEVDIHVSMRVALEDFFNTASRYVVNDIPDANARVCPHAVLAVDTTSAEDWEIRSELGRRWEEQLALDAAVATVRGGSLVSIIAAVESAVVQRLFARNRSILADFVSLLVASDQTDIRDHAMTMLKQNADLARETYNGRMLLHAACAAGHLPMVEWLLLAGNDPNTQDRMGHTPLYYVGNSCASGGGAVVRALVDAGAEPDAAAGVQKCTPLHMAARRGYVEVAEALLECGADIEARDRNGDSPLRRAVNCGQIRMASMLVLRGADASSRGSRGLTPRTAAKSAPMRALFHA